MSFVRVVGKHGSMNSTVMKIKKRLTLVLTKEGFFSKKEDICRKWINFECNQNTFDMRGLSEKGDINH